MKVLFIDPWGINETSEYTNGLCAAISKYVELKLVSNFYYVKKTDADYEVSRSFFKFSQNMAEGKFRKILRGYEYIRSWNKIISDIRRNKYDCIHINWLLSYKTDISFLKKVKQTGTKVVYTAHNVLPHVNGDRYIDELRKIYGLVDRIVLHGTDVKKEFEEIFPEFAAKTYIQKHGCNIKKDISFDIEKVDQEIVKKVEKYRSIFLFVGNVFYNKGTDRLLKIWLQNDSLKDSLLIIAGKETEKDADFVKTYAAMKKQANSKENILILDWFVPNNTINYFFTVANVVVLPYRHASMSGVVFTAIDFAKPIIATKVGAIPEYLENVEGAFLVENDDEKLEKCVLEISEGWDPDQLSDMGFACRETMHQVCSWENIAGKLYENCYKL